MKRCKTGMFTSEEKAWARAKQHNRVKPEFGRQHLISLLYKKMECVWVTDVSKVDHPTLELTYLWASYCVRFKSLEVKSLPVGSSILIKPLPPMGYITGPNLHQTEGARECYQHPRPVDKNVELSQRPEKNCQSSFLSSLIENNSSLI